jgi:hypothetical protein
MASFSACCERTLADGTDMPRPDSVARTNHNGGFGESGSTVSLEDPVSRSE